MAYIILMSVRICIKSVLAIFYLSIGSYRSYVQCRCGKHIKGNSHKCMSVFISPTFLEERHKRNCVLRHKSAQYEPETTWANWMDFDRKDRSTCWPAVQRCATNAPTQQRTGWERVSIWLYCWFSSQSVLFVFLNIFGVRIMILDCQACSKYKYYLHIRHRKERYWLIAIVDPALHLFTRYWSGSKDQY